MRADSSGEVWVTVGIMAVGGVIGAGISAASFIATQNGPMNWKSFGVAVASGFISGAVAASPLGLSGQIAAGALIGGGSYIADSLINNKTIKLDEAIVATSAGALSGRIGGAGANQYGTLSKAIKLSTKTSAKYATKSSTKYAAKRIASAKSYRNNTLSLSAWGSSARFSAGIGASNMFTNTWSKVKSWFSGVFK